VAAPQTLPHIPQLFWLVVVSTHVPLQLVPDEQVQAPAAQVSPPAVLHAWPHEPQLPVSIDVSVQMPVHSVSLF